MAAFLRLVGQLSVKGAKWAWSNKDRVLQWLANGMSFNWIKEKIEDIVS